jgi:hypothetical protein
VNNIEESITNLPNPVVQKSGVADGVQVTILNGLHCKAESISGDTSTASDPACTESNEDPPANEWEPVPVCHVPFSTVEADSPVAQSHRAPHFVPEVDPARVSGGAGLKVP